MIRNIIFQKSEQHKWEIRAGWEQKGYWLLKSEFILLTHVHFERICKIYIEIL